MPWPVRNHKEMRCPSDGVQAFGTLTVIAESPNTPAVLWAGTDDGNLQVSRDGGESWNNVAANVPGLPKGTYVSRVVASKTGDGVAYATFDGHRSDDYSVYLYSTSDFGRTWKAASAGIPKDVGTVHAFREHPRNPNVLFVGAEFGLFASNDRGASWTKLTGNFPTVPVFDIAIHPRENDLILGTHGRGVWIVDDITPMEQFTPAILETPLYAFESRPAIEWRISDPKGVTGNKLMMAKNPAYGAIIQYYLKTAPSGKEEAKVAISDRSGKLLREIKGPKAAGIQRVVWDLRLERPLRHPAKGPDCSSLGQRTAHW